MEKLTQKTYRIPDVWLLIAALKSVSFFAVLIYVILLFSIFLLKIKDPYITNHLMIFSSIYIGVFLIYFIRVFIVFNKGYVIDLEKQEFRFPATDIENSFLEVITFKKYRDYARVKKLALTDISDIFIDTQRKKVFSSTTNKTTRTIYTLNIVGFHGSNNLNFSSRQKRDEVRGILVQAAKEAKVKIQDRKVAEFG